MIDDMLKLVGAVSGAMAGNYESRCVALVKREDNNGVGVSTAWTDDMGFETALLHSRVSPVERYISREDAEKGHEKWVAFAADTNNTEVVELGYESLIEDESVKIR